MHRRKIRGVSGVGERRESCRHTGSRNFLIQIIRDPGRIHVDAGSIIADIDGPKVERIVENLVVNATRHTPDGTPIWVRIAPCDEGVLIIVDDAGPGVPDDIKEAIFEPFRQGPENRPSPGTGIGLSLVARFAELHGGRAWVEDRERGGASFRVLLRALREEATHGHS